MAFKLLDSVWQNQLALMPDNVLQIGPSSRCIDIDWDFSQPSKWIPQSVARYLKRATQFDSLPSSLASKRTAPRDSLRDEVLISMTNCNSAAKIGFLV